MNGLPALQQRRIWTQVETVLPGAGPRAAGASRVAAMAVVLANPSLTVASTTVNSDGNPSAASPDSVMSAMPALAVQMADRLIHLLQGDAATIRSRGLGLMTRSAGQVADDNAWQQYGGRAVDDWLEQAGCHVPYSGNADSSVMSGGPGAACRIVLRNIQEPRAARSDHRVDEITVAIAGHPRADEMICVLAFSEDIHDAGIAGAHDGQGTS